MMVQITAASLVAESRTLAMPASIGSIPTDANQEDFVPMGMAAAYKTRRILVNARRVVAAELLCGAQGLEFLRPLTPGRGVGELYRRIRGRARPGAARRPASAPDLERLAAALATGASTRPAGATPALACHVWRALSYPNSKPSSPLPLSPPSRMNLEKLKDTARKYEQKEDWRRAIDVYLKAIQEIESGREPRPISRSTTGSATCTSR